MEKYEKVRLLLSESDGDNKKIALVVTK
ncbi:MAG: hypothetical protein RLZZ69_3854, partial [Cyanobacteriota bacterium]